MTKKILAAVAATAMTLGVATSAGSTDFTAQASTKAMDLTECQLAHLASCYKIWGDYPFCYQQAEDYAC